MNEKTLDQRRAADALEKIKLLEKDPRRGNYKSYVKALPANILMNGLGQAAATARSHTREGYPQLYENLSSWLCGNDPDVPYRNHPEQDLLKAIVDKDQDHYLHAQAEALAYLGWLKKFAEAFLENDKEE